MKKRLFIGGSSEELGTAKIVKAMLDADFDVTIWNDTIWEKEVFKLNHNFLSDLLKAPLKFDFGILIGTPDDATNKRGKEVLTARDNILFELGLFMGRMGIENCAFLVNDTVDIPTDFGGIYLSKFNTSTLADVVTRIKTAFIKGENDRVNFFPSTTLAHAYFENFVKSICQEFYDSNSFSVDDVTYTDCKFRIIIPNVLSEDLNQQFQKIKNGIGVVEKLVTSPNRSRTYSIDVKGLSSGKLEILDFPTTLTGINYAIRELLPDEYRTNGDDYRAILHRELDRFILTLNKLITRYDYGDFVSVEKMS